MSSDVRTFNVLLAPRLFLIIASMEAWVWEQANSVSFFIDIQGKRCEVRCVIREVRIDINPLDAGLVLEGNLPSLIRSRKHGEKDWTDVRINNYFPDRKEDRGMTLTFHSHVVIPKDFMSQNLIQ